MLANSTEQNLVHKTGAHVSISTGHELPIEVTVTAKLPPGAGSFIIENALSEQEKHPEFLDEYNEPSALIGKTNFAKADHTAIYTFGVDKRNLVFHRHAGHRAITAITGNGGCVLKFSLCSPGDALRTPEKFAENLYIIRIPADRLFVLRFSGTVYHQFCPGDRSENGFFAVSVHADEAGGLRGYLLQEVLNNRGNIPLLTEPAPDEAVRLAETDEFLATATSILLDID